MRAVPWVIWYLLIKVGFPIALIFLVMLSKNWWRSQRESRADSWPAAQGNILQGKVVSMSSGRRSVIQMYECTLSYNYFAGEYHAGVYKKIFRSEQAADDFATACKGKDVQVRYNPTSPSKSVLREQDLRLVVPVALAPQVNTPGYGERRGIWQHVRTVLRPFI